MNGGLIGARALNGQDRCSRFSRLSAPAAGAVLALLAALIVLGVNLPARRTPVPAAPGRDDIGLYSRVIDRVRAGEPYASAAIAEQRAAGYPVKPFVAVRPPLLAAALSRLPDALTADVLLAGLAGLVIIAWTARLRTLRSSVAWLAATPLIVFTGVEATMTLAGMSRLHETWAGLLIALSLALRTDRRFAAAVTLGLLAGVIRELAMPYLVVMALVALAERKRVEAEGDLYPRARRLPGNACPARGHGDAAADPPRHGFARMGDVWRLAFRGLHRQVELHRLAPRRVGRSGDPPASDRRRGVQKEWPEPSNLPA